MKATLSPLVSPPTVNAIYIDTPLGAMLAIADQQGLYLLAFSDCRDMELESERFYKRTKQVVILGENLILQQIQSELKAYFSGENVLFKTPLHVIGSDFQKHVWCALHQIPLGQTRSYLQIAQSLNYPTACRAVARANASNPLSVIIPCHRVINHNGNLGGYFGGVDRKQWLLAHEKNLLVDN